jgi:hypothetical protein
MSDEMTTGSIFTARTASPLGAGPVALKGKTTKTP